MECCVIGIQWYGLEGISGAIYSDAFCKALWHWNSVAWCCVQSSIRALGFENLRGQT